MIYLIVVFYVLVALGLYFMMENLYEFLPIWCFRRFMAVAFWPVTLMLYGLVYVVILVTVLLAEIL